MAENPNPENAAAPAAPVVTEADAVPAKKGKARVLIIVGSVVMLLLVGGGALYYFMSGSSKPAVDEEKSAEARLKAQIQHRKENKPPVFVALDEVLVNLPGRGGEHYLQAKIVLRTVDAATETRIKQFMPLIRDKVITVMSARQMQDLATVEGKGMLAKEIALVINSIIEPQLTAIYVLQQQPSTADLRNLERIGALPKETAAGTKVTEAAREAAAQFWRITEMDLPVQAVLFNSFVMQ